MGRRIPTALHNELSEYASLLRALRTRDALDVTKHLIKGSPFAATSSTSVDGLDETGDPVAGPSKQPQSAASRPAGKTRSAAAKGKQKAVAAAPELSSKPKQIKRDHWTRWPLLLDDVIKPEWTLEDEVAVIASQVLKSRAPPSFPFPVSEENDDTENDEFVYVNTEVDEDDPDHPFYTPYLTSIVASYLSTMLALLASHTPARPASMQNRIEPLNWRAVLDVVVSCGVPEFSNPMVVQNVIRRMEAIYGPSILPIEGRMATSYRAVERMKGKEAAAEEFAKFFQSYEANYFSQASPPPSFKPSKTRTKRKRNQHDDNTPRAQKHRKAAKVRFELSDAAASGGESEVPCGKESQTTLPGLAKEHLLGDTTSVSRLSELPGLGPRRSSRKKAAVNHYYPHADE
ncbi:hypothetical protein NLJ89_g1811 [Agrocybe chaxingu]|uniref:Uncharacterized protein n=1 Tax=Agrocybe chaxingu TaxID=84603 RepID=A0A9W8MZC4_9AGAR|nr:hypothetical protein NLJ89_g1811 [Agrocybe chaxingu]